MAEHVLVHGKFRKLYYGTDGEYVMYKGKKLYLHAYIKMDGE